MTITISKDVLSQELNGETVLLDMAGEQYFGLDAVGTRIWQLLNDGKGEGEIVEILLAEYEVERPELEADVADLLKNLAKSGLVTIG